MFALQNGGWCASAENAENTYNKYGSSTNCHADGKGGGSANQVYKILLIGRVTIDLISIDRRADLHFIIIL